MSEQQEREQRIRERAYQIWLEQGRPQGKDRDNWAQAEGELRAGNSDMAESPIPGPYENIA